MKKTITITILGIIMMASVLAIYSGESMTFETNMTNPMYTVVGNSSNLDGMDVTLDNGNITISFAYDYKSDDYTMLFFENETYEVEKIVYRGGGTKTKTKLRYVDRDVIVYEPEYITEYVDVDNDPIELNNVCDDDEVTCNETNVADIMTDEKSNMWIWILGTVALLLIIVVYFIVKK